MQYKQTYYFTWILFDPYMVTTSSILTKKTYSQENGKELSGPTHTHKLKLKHAKRYHSTKKKTIEFSFKV